MTKNKFDKELALQYEEKEKLTAELNIAKTEIDFQNREKVKREEEFSVANIELAFQNEEKEKRAAELSLANIELVFQNEEKEKRAAELIIANKELLFQNEEKEKRAAELIIINQELAAFAYIASHDLQEPLRKIQTFGARILEQDNDNLSERSVDYFQRMCNAAKRMQTLIIDILAFSRINTTQRIFESISLSATVEKVMTDLKDDIGEKQALIEAGELCHARVIPFQFYQLMENLISNSLKFSRQGVQPHIVIKSRIIKGSESGVEALSPEKDYCHITVSDNGIGFETHFNEKIFEVFQKLHPKEEYKGTGIGLAIVKKIVENHDGIITAAGEIGKGARFDIYLPAAA